MTACPESTTEGMEYRAYVRIGPQINQVQNDQLFCQPF
jgi:hypothetical protein